MDVTSGELRSEQQISKNEMWNDTKNKSIKKLGYISFPVALPPP